MIRRAVVGAVLLALLGAVSVSGAGAAESRLQVVRGVSPTSIKVGGLGDAQRYVGADIGAKARFARANAAGGVNGRTFDYIGFRDDKGVGQANQQLGAELVEQDQVFAVVPTITADLGAVKTFTDQKVPYFGWALSSNFCGNTYGFGFTGCLFPPGGKTTSDAWGLVVKQALGATPNPTAVLFTENTASGQVVLPGLTAGVKSAGVTVAAATNSLPVPAVGDYEGLANSVLNAKGGQPADAVFVVGGYSNVVQLQQALRTAGYAGLFTDAIEYDPDLIASSTATAVMLQTAALESAPTNPAMAQLVADVRAVAPDASIDLAIVAGYFSADLFIAAVQRGGKNLTLAGFLKKANKGFTYAVPNTVGPTTFPAAHNEPTPCGSLVRSDGSAYVVLVPYTCGKVVRVSP